MKLENNYFHSLQAVICLQPQHVTVVVPSYNLHTKKRHYAKMRFPLLGPSNDFHHFLLGLMFFFPPYPLSGFIPNLLLFKGLFECCFGFAPHAKPLVLITKGILMIATEANSWAATTFLRHDTLLQTS